MRDWREVVDARNPANVPRSGLRANQRWMPLEAASSAQVFRLRSLMEAAGAQPVSVALLFGDGFTDVESLSKWSASWGIEQFQAFLDEVTERQMKRWIASQYREASGA